MSKRKPATAAKHGHSPKIAAKAQRAAQAIVRSSKDRRLHIGEAGTAESSPKRHNDSQRNDSQKASLPVENLATTLQEVRKQAVMYNVSKKGIDFSLAAANVWAYQAKLLEIAQANMQFAFEFAQRIAAIRSPVEFPSVIAEFSSKRIAMFRKHSTEIAKLSSER